MLFTSVGSLPGLIMVKWNVQAESQGSVGIWDAHFRVGGAYGSGMCPIFVPNTSSSISSYYGPYYGETSYLELS